MRLDLPTLDRPAHAISTPRIGGSTVGELAAATNCQSPANNLRPASISRWVKSVMRTAYSKWRSANRRAGAGLTFRLFLLPEQCLDVVEQFDLGAVPAHDDALLGHRERVVPGPVDHETGRKIRQHEGEDDRHP